MFQDATYRWSLRGTGSSQHPSAALAPETASEIGRLESTFGVPVVAGLATTETGVITQQRLPPPPRRAGALGTPLGCEIRLLDERGDEVAQGEVGEVHVRGPQVFAGYLDDPALDALVFADGWYRPGDLARFGDGGELRLVGRTREMINRGGEKIAPVDIGDGDQPGHADALTVVELGFGEHGNLASGHRVARQSLACALATTFPSTFGCNFGQAKSQPGIASKHRHTEGKRFHAAFTGKLIDEAFVEKGRIAVRTAPPGARGHPNVGRAASCAAPSCWAASARWA